MKLRTSAAWGCFVGLAAAGCVPAGNATPQDAGTTSTNAANPAAALPQQPAVPAAAAAASSPAASSAEVLKTPFEDDFERTGPATAPSGASPGVSSMPEPGPEWAATAPGLWHIEGGRLCGEHARNHGLWLKRALPVNARIEFDAISQSADGDLKAEFWGDGRSFAQALSYSDATSYLTIFGGWHNKFHVLARINEHGNDRKEITVDRDSDDPREHPVMAGQIYHFKVERSDGKTIKWWVDGNEMFAWADAAPLAGPGHDHFGFNDWDVKVCFDNVKVVPLP
jgi:hypothetical protein